MDRKCYGGNAAIKLDVAKAFDTLSWDFLLHVLARFGFHDTFRSCISSLLKSTPLSVLINGSPFGFFDYSRGVRQDDPLSPILFCLVEDVLSRGISKMASDGKNISYFFS